MDDDFKPVFVVLRSALGSAIKVSAIICIAYLIIIAQFWSDDRYQILLILFSFIFGSIGIFLLIYLYFNKKYIQSPFIIFYEDCVLYNDMLIPYSDVQIIQRVTFKKSRFLNSDEWLANKLEVYFYNTEKISIDESNINSDYIQIKSRVEKIDAARFIKYNEIEKLI